MAIAIASADQYVFKRNYAEKRWENVDAKDRACKVQVLKKNNEFTFKVSVEGGAVSCLLVFSCQFVNHEW